MSTVPHNSGRKIDLPGAVAYWTARRTPRDQVVNALAAVNEGTIPPIDEFDALRETGEMLIASAKINTRNTPVRADSLSRKGVGVEFTQTHKGDSENSREFLFSIGVSDKGRAFFLKKGVHPAFQTLFNHTACDAQLDAMYQHNLTYMPSRDVTEAIVGLITRNRSIRLKENGGVYFVPECAIDIVDTVFAALNAAGSRCTLLMHDLSENEEFRKQILDTTNEGLVDSLEQMQAEIRDILDNDKKPRINGIRTKMKSLADYADVLDYYQKTFNVGLTASQEAMKTTFDLLAELQLRYKGEDQ